MEDVLRWSLLVVGSCVIIGVAVHGIWVSRKNSEQKPKKHRVKPELQTEDQYQANEMSDDDSDVSIDFDDDVEKATVNVDSELGDTSNQALPKFDDLGLSSVRVVSTNPTTEDDTASVNNDNESTHVKNEEIEKVIEPKVEQQSNSTPSKIYASVVTQPKPEFSKKSHVSMDQGSNHSQQSQIVTSSSVGSHKTTVTNGTSQVSTSSETDGYQAPEPPPFLLKKDAPTNTETPKSVEAPLRTAPKVEPPVVAAKIPDAESQAAEKLSLGEQARNLVKRKKAESTRKRREPKMAEDQMRIDFDEEANEQVEQTQATKPEAKQPKVEQPQEVLVLNVKTPDGEPISGAALLPMLLTLGFKFGDQDIFHRHVNSNGKGPVLFSLANMFKPGVFDIDNLENFTTQGVSLFMILPIEGEPHQVFNMMHNAARKISEEFSAQIFDAKRTLLTKQSLQQYVEKIREFERQRMLNNG